MGEPKFLPVVCWFARVALLLAALALPSAQPARAQGAAQSEVRARFDSGVVKLGSQVNLYVEVEGARSAEIVALPQVDGLRFGGIGPPGVSESYVIEQGRQTYQRTLTWRIPVQPLQKGEFVLPPFAVRADGRELLTRELRLRAVEDLKGEELGLLEIDAPREVRQGQPFWVEIRFGFDAQLQGRLNHYNLSLPWLGELSGLVELDAPGSGASSPSKIALNGRRELAVEGLGARQSGASTFHTWRARKRFVATRSGKLSFPTSHFEFGKRDDGFGSLFGRPSEEFVYYKRSAPFEIDVQPLPEAGRPLDFSGAVGRFEASALADRRDVVAGDSIKLTVEWTGDGNLEFFDPPDLTRLEAFEGFRVYGTQDRKTFDRRTVVYDLAPVRADIEAIPAVPLSVFDTASGGYRAVATQPITIRVRLLAGATGLTDAPARADTALDIRDIQVRALGPPAVAAPPGWLIAGLAGGVLAAWLALRAWVRRRGDPAAPAARARRRARRELARALRAAATPAEQARALQTFLAARTGERPEAWIGRDPVAWAQRLERAMPAEDARALSQALERLDAAIWGGGAAREAPEKLPERELLALTDRLAAGGL